MHAYVQIDVVADLPVGENLQDHLSAPLTLLYNNFTGVDSNAAVSPWSLVDYYLFGKGEYLNMWIIYRTRRWQNGAPFSLWIIIDKVHVLVNAITTHLINYSPSPRFFSPYTKP